MKVTLFLFVIILSGIASGIALGISNLFLVEPHIEKAIQIETQNSIKNGEKINSDDQNIYRQWQKEGLMAASIVFGVSFSILFGIVYNFLHSAFPKIITIKKTIILALIMWSTLFLVTSIKYPANPPAVGDPNTIIYRQSLYTGFLILSGLTALSLGIIYKKTNLIPKQTLPLVYMGVMAVSFLLFPNNPDKVDISTSLLFDFRISSTITMLVFWLVMGLTFGILWNKFKPNETISIMSN